MRKMIVCGPEATFSGPGTGSINGYDGENVNIIQRTNSTWVRFWLSWNDCQGYGDHTKTDVYRDHAPSSFAESWNWLNQDSANEIAPFRRLDDQIARANANGRGIILTIADVYPLWSNHNYPANDPRLEGKDPEAELPLDGDADSPWSWFVSYLCCRYAYGAPPNNPGPSPSGGPIYGNPSQAWINALEICNEPNLKNVIGGNNGHDLVCAVTTMFQTAANNASYWGAPPGVFFPGTADSHPGEEQLRSMDFYDFTEMCMSSLEGWRGPSNIYTAWSHHTYREDIMYQYDGQPRGYLVRFLMDHHDWKPPTDRLVFFTEGSDKWVASHDSLAAKQAAASRIHDTFYRNQNWGYLFSQYQIQDPPVNGGTTNDSALYDVDGSPRPAYYTWRDLFAENTP